MRLVRFGRALVMLEDDGFFDVSSIMRCAVYALVRRGVPVYIGQSKTAYQRLYTHLRKRKKPGVHRTGMYSNQVVVGMVFDEVWIRPCMLGELDRIEKEMIKKYEPKYNTKIKPPPPSISLEMLIDMVPRHEWVPLLPPNPEPRTVPSWRRL